MFLIKMKMDSNKKLDHIHNSNADNLIKSKETTAKNKNSSKSNLVITRITDEEPESESPIKKSI